MISVSWKAVRNTTRDGKLLPTQAIITHTEIFFEKSCLSQQFYIFYLENIEINPDKTPNKSGVYIYGGYGPLKKIAVKINFPKNMTRRILLLLVT